MPKTCTRCKQSNTTYCWWESLGSWVCLPCGMGRRNEQNKIELKYIKDHKCKK